ncbi:hypothetical protein C8Q77DRAFT_1143683 [Trametes polyzona]|nr:hypothetical protein C8Q77DRAFT_1143683 [Trametes polyzona]
MLAAVPHPQRGLEINGCMVFALVANPLRTLDGPEVGSDAGTRALEQHIFQAAPQLWKCTFKQAPQGDHMNMMRHAALNAAQANNLENAGTSAHSHPSQALFPGTCICSCGRSFNSQFCGSRASSPRPVINLQSSTEVSAGGGNLGARDGLAAVAGIEEKTRRRANDRARSWPGFWLLLHPWTDQGLHRTEETSACEAAGRTRAH